MRCHDGSSMHQYTDSEDAVRMKPISLPPTYLKYKQCKRCNCENDEVRINAEIVEDNMRVKEKNFERVSSNNKCPDLGAIVHAPFRRYPCHRHSGSADCVGTNLAPFFFSILRDMQVHRACYTDTRGILIPCCIEFPQSQAILCFRSNTNSGFARSP